MHATGVTVRFGDVVALPATTFRIDEGERVCVVGRNGAGKSTLLRILAGLLEPTAGSISGRPARGAVVLVHQRPHLFRGTALDNVRLGASLNERGPVDAVELLDRLGVATVARRDVRGLSGGERRRVAIARALARGPAWLLLDEPLAEVDSSGVERVTAAVAAFEGTVITSSPLGRSPLATRELRIGS